MKNWIGKALLIIGAIHTLFGMIVFQKQWLLWIQEGLWNTVSGQAEREWAFWFIAIGILAMILGAFTNWVEKQIHNLPDFFTYSLLIFSLVGVILMPISGIWLILFTSLGAIWQYSRSGVLAKN